MSYKSKAELDSRTIRVKKEDYLRLNELSQKAGISLGDSIHRLLEEEKAVFLNSEDFNLLKGLSEKEGVLPQILLHQLLEKANLPKNLNW